MIFLLHAIISIVYTALAVAAAVFLPVVFVAFPAQHAPLIGSVIFLASVLVHVAHVQSGRTRDLEEHLHAVRSAYQQLAADVDFAYNESISLREALADTRRSDAKRMSDMVGEVRVLQRLIERYANKKAIAGKPKSRPTDPEAAPVGAAPAGNRPFAGLAEDKPDAPKAVVMPRVAQDLDDGEVLDVLREGLRLDRVDVYLQPVVSLPQRKARFYECFTRIRAEDGSVVVPEQYIDLAHQEGLVTDIDNMLLFRCVQLIRRSQRRSNDGTMFQCNISNQTLADAEFFADFVDFIAENDDLAPNLIFEFRQQDIEGADEDLRRNLKRLADLGFRFSLDQISHFNMNLSALARSHFRYLKLDAERILEHLENPGGDADIQELKQRLDRERIDLIVEKIEREQQLRELLDFNIDYGQGFLFGEPRLSRDD